MSSRSFSNRCSMSMRDKPGELAEAHLEDVLGLQLGEPELLA